MTGNVDPPVQREKRWPKVALAVSLAFNLLIVGFLAGAIARKSGDVEQQARVPALAAFGAPYMMALPRQDRRAVLREMRAGLEGDVPDRQERREMFESVLSVLRSVPFDLKALQEAVSRQADTTIRVQRSAQQAWLNVVANMSDAERAAYAAAVEEMLRRAPRRK